VPTDQVFSDVLIMLTGLIGGRQVAGLFGADDHTDKAFFDA
jgi:hypothetical protein